MLDPVRPNTDFHMTYLSFVAANLSKSKAPPLVLGLAQFLKLSQL